MTPTSWMFCTSIYDFFRFWLILPPKLIFKLKTYCREYVPTQDSNKTLYTKIRSKTRQTIGNGGPQIGIKQSDQEPKLPLHQNPNMWFVHEISQSNYKNLYNPPLWLFRDKTTTHIDFSQQNKTYGSTIIFYNTKRYIKINLEVFNLLQNNHSLKTRFLNFTKQEKVR